MSQNDMANNEPSEKGSAPSSVASTIDTQTPAPHLQFDESGLLKVDLDCNKCGYNLRGMSLDKTCPECGHSVSDSARGGYLIYSDRRWLKHLMVGDDSIRAAALMQIIVFCSMIFLLDPSRESIWTFCLLAQVIVLAGFAIGIWLFTRPEPNPTVAQPRFGTRRWTRITLAGGIVILAVILTMDIFLSWIALSNSPYANLLSLRMLKRQIQQLALGGYGSVFVGLIFFFLYTRNLALRFPDPRLAKDCMYLMWTYIGTGVLSLATLIMAIFLNDTNKMPTLVLALTFTTGILALAGTVIIIIHIFLALRTVRRHLKALIQGGELKLQDLKKRPVDQD